MQTVPQPAPLVLTRLLHGPVETVFKAWCDGESVARWFAPEPYRVPSATIEPKVGGRWELVMRSPTGVETLLKASIVELVPNRRLVLDMHVADAAGKPLFRAYTELDFSEALRGTQLDVRQTYTFADPAMAGPMLAGAPTGWGMTLDQLDREAVRLTGGSGAVARSVVHAVFHLERTYHAPTARVWLALTDEAHKRKWFSGSNDSWEQIERHMDVRPGGRERLKSRWQSGLVTTFDAVYHDVIPGERLVYSYEMHLDDKKISVSLATMQLTAVGGKTTLQVTEQGAFLDGYDDAGAREHGTGQLLDMLGASLKE